MDALEIFETH